MLHVMLHNHTDGGMGWILTQSHTQVGYAMKHIASAEVRARFTAMSDNLDALASKQLAGDTSHKDIAPYLHT